MTIPGDQERLFRCYNHQFPTKIESHDVKHDSDDLSRQKNDNSSQVGMGSPNKFDHETYCCNPISVEPYTAEIPTEAVDHDMDGGPQRAMYCQSFGP